MFWPTRYYYLTEIALRRIGNRIINTFFVPDRESWLHIEPYLDIAIEFEAQVSSWHANLPPTIQVYETNSTIRQPRIESTNGMGVDTVSRELSWAVENRLLEMRSWLYQPFLYYLVHATPQRPLSEFAANSPISTHAPTEPPFISESSNVLWSLIMRGIDCNMTILETRSLPHRHHGLWYDLRAIMCASLILLAIVKSGYSDLVSGGTSELVGAAMAWNSSPQLKRLRTDSSTSSRVSPHVAIGGKFGQVLAQLRLWSMESPDITRHADVLENLIRDIMTWQWVR